MSPDLTADEVAQAIVEYTNRRGNMTLVVRNEDGTEWPVKHVTLERRGEEDDRLRVVLE